MAFGILRRALAICAFVLVLSPAYATDIIQTIAGGGSLEGYKPLEANLLLGTSAGLAVNSLGEVLVSDSGHNQVVKINPTTGLLTIVAGDGTASYFGDGLPAASAGLNGPGGLALDAAGNLFIVDRGNFVIRRVDALSGVITTVAGTGLYTGQVVGTNPAAVYGEGVGATTATFGAGGGGAPAMGDITVDSTGAIIVADTANQTIRKFTVGGNIATIAGVLNNNSFSGDGAAGGALAATFSNPTGVLADSAGNVYISDSGNRRVRKLDSSNTLNTVAGDGTGGNNGFSGDGGAATSAQVGSLGGLAFDKAGALLISCVNANHIRKVDVASASPIIVTIAGNGGSVIGDLGPATGATLSLPRDVAVDAQGNIFIYDSGNGRVRRIDFATGFIDTVIGTGLRGFIGDRGPNQGGVLVTPKGAAYDGSGNLFIADTGDNSVRKVAPDGTITTFCGVGTTTVLGDGGPANLASLNAPNDVAVSGTSLFIADTGHNLVRKVDLTTNVITTFASINAPLALAFDSGGVLYVAHGTVIDTVATDGTVAAYAGGTPVNTVANPHGDGLAPASAQFRPRGLAFNQAGDLFVADTQNNLIRKISANVVSTVAGGGTPTFPSVGDGGPALSASLNNPNGVAIDSTGRLIISDTDNQRIRAVDSAGNISSIAGNGTPGFSGDGDVAASALVNSPAKVFLNGTAIVFVDSNNNRVRKIITALDIDPKLLSFAAKLTFSIDKKTGQLAMGKDAVALKTALPLPAGISAANLLITVDIIDLHQQIQLDKDGKMPKPVKASKTKITPTVFDFALPHTGPPAVSKFSFSLKGTSVAGAKPTSFGFASKGTFREELGRAGFTDVTTAKDGVNLPVRVDITLGTTTFTGLTTVQWKATQGKGGAAKSIKTK